MNDFEFEYNGIFTESSEDIGLLYSEYKDMKDDILKLLGKIEGEMKFFLKDPKNYTINLKDDIDQFKKNTNRKLSPKEIDMQKIKYQKKEVKAFKNNLDDILKKYSNIKDKISFGGNYFRAILKRPKVYSKEIDYDAYDAINRNIRNIDRAMDWIEKVLMDLYNMADHDLNVLTLVGEVYAKKRIYESYDEDLLLEYIESGQSSNEGKYKIIHKKSKYKGWTEYIVLAKDGNEAASCIINPKTGDCADVETKPKYRRQGYMQYLLKYLIKFKGVKYAQVRQDNHIAISLYRKIGFKIEFKYTNEDQGPMYSMVFNGDISNLIVEGYNIFIEADEPPSIDDSAGEEESPEEETIESENKEKEDNDDVLEEPIEESEPEKTDKDSNEEPEESEDVPREEPEETPPEEQVKEEKPKELSRSKQTDAAESNKNGIRRKKLYIAFIEWCKEYNNKNIFGSIFDKDVFKVSYPFVPDEMRYFYRLANPMLCVLGGQLTFFPVSELRKLNSKNNKLNEMMIFAATPNDLRIFNLKDKKIYIGTGKDNTIELGEVLADSFDLYIQNMIKKGDILNGPIEESVELKYFDFY